MVMPINLFLLRHGESEGNVANKRSRLGDHRDFTDEFKGRHNSTWRLTDRGIKQAQIAGQWLRENGWSKFDRYYSSEFARALETAYNLQLPGAKWFSDFFMRERGWGNLDNMSYVDRIEQYGDIMKRRQIDGFYWQSHSGESMADLCLRLEKPLNTLHRECSNMKVLIVCHGEVMWGFLIRLLKLTTRQYMELEAKNNVFDKIHNCQIIHFTRYSDEGKLHQKYVRWRSICPWDTTISRNEWQPIIRRGLTNDQLAEELEHYPRMLSA